MEIILNIQMENKGGGTQIGYVERYDEHTETMVDRLWAAKEDGRLYDEAIGAIMDAAQKATSKKAAFTAIAAVVAVVEEMLGES